MGGKGQQARMWPSLWVVCMVSSFGVLASCWFEAIPAALVLK